MFILRLLFKAENLSVCLSSCSNPIYISHTCCSDVKAIFTAFVFQTNRTQVLYDPLSDQQKYEITQQVRRYVEGTLDEIDVSRLRGLHHKRSKVYIDTLSTSYMEIKFSFENEVYVIVYIQTITLLHTLLVRVIWSALSS